MALGLLWLGFTLLWAPQTQAEHSPLGHLLSQPLSPALSTIPLTPDFKADQFQGKWYAIGVAESVIQNGTESQLDMYSTTYELKTDHSYIVTALMLKKEVCEIWVKELSPCAHPGEFTLSNMHDYSIIKNYTVRVVATDYKQFGLVLLRMLLPNSVYTEVTLYGRTKELSPKLREDFVKFSLSVGLTNDNIIFTDPIEDCIDI